jgi:hypothetical protein
LDVRLRKIEAAGPWSVPGCTSSALEDRKTAGAYEEPDDDQQQTEEDVARKEQHDPYDDEDYGDDPEDETHVVLLPAAFLFHTGCDFAAAQALRGDAQADELGNSHRLVTQWGSCPFTAVASASR